MPKPIVIQTEDLAPEPAAWLAQRAELIHCGVADDRFNELIADAQGLIVRTYTIVDEALLNRAPRLKVVARAGVGLDNIDIPACQARGIEVVHTPQANTRAVVEFVTSAILGALRPIERVDAGGGAMDIEAWKELRRQTMAPRQLSDLTLGIYGLGRIGSQVARLAAALDMTVIYNDLAEIPVAKRFGAEPVSVETLLAESDVLTIHVDGRTQNRGLINAQVLARTKQDLLLINTSRGFVIQADALAAFLKKHPDAQALIDVHDPEPFGSDYPLLGLDNCTLTAHIAAGTVSAKTAMSWVVEDVWRVLNGERAEQAAKSPSC